MGDCDGATQAGYRRSFPVTAFHVILWSLCETYSPYYSMNKKNLSTSSIGASEPVNVYMQSVVNNLIDLHTEIMSTVMTHGHRLEVLSITGRVTGRPRISDFKCTPTLFVKKIYI